MGCCVVLGVLLAIIIKTFATGACSEDILGSFICAGIGGAFMAQIFVNVGMNLRLLPVIGVTLPFYSAGGSSVLMLYICTIRKNCLVKSLSEQALSFSACFYFPAKSPKVL